MLYEKSTFTTLHPTCYIITAVVSFQNIDLRDTVTDFSTLKTSKRTAL